MAARRSRASRRLIVVVVAACAVLGLALLAGVVTAAHRDPGYRHSVDSSFGASASAVVWQSNVTGATLAHVMADPGGLGRVLLESRLQQLAQHAVAESAAAARLAPPPPDANAATRLDEAMRLRAAATVSIRTTLEGLLGLTPTNPTGTAGAEPPAAPVVRVPGARALLRLAGQQLVLADRIYHGLPFVFFVSSGGASLPQSRWTLPVTGRLMPETLLNDAQRIANDPRLHATIHLSIVAVQTDPLLLPVGPGYPISPTSTFTVAISVVNSGSSPSLVTAIIRVRPLGRLGHFDSGRATGVVTALGAVAIRLPTMAVVPGERCHVTIDLVRPVPQLNIGGLHWARDVVVGQNAPVP